jgi:hypothetical protein
MIEIVAIICLTIFAIAEVSTRRKYKARIFHDINSYDEQKKIANKIFEIEDGIEEEQGSE